MLLAIAHWYSFYSISRSTTQRTGVYACNAGITIITSVLLVRAADGPNAIAHTMAFAIEPIQYATVLQTIIFFEPLLIHESSVGYRIGKWHFKYTHATHLDWCRMSDGLSTLLSNGQSRMEMKQHVSVRV